MDEDELVASIIATGGTSGRVHIWNTAFPEKPLQSVSCGSAILALAVVESPRYLVAACADGTVSAWPMKGTEIDQGDSALAGLAVASDQELTCMVAVPGKNEVVVGLRSGKLKVVCIQSHATVGPAFDGHAAAVLCCATFCVGSEVFLASGSIDGSCRLWSVSDRRCVAVLTAPSTDSGPASVNAVVGTHLGGEDSLASLLVVTGHSDRALRVWDAAAALASGGAGPTHVSKPLDTLQEHADSILHCTATSRRLVSCSLDASVKFWSWRDGKGHLEHSNYDFVKAVTKVHVGRVDGKEMVYAIGEEGVVRGWDSKHVQLVAVDVQDAEEDDANLQLNDVVVFLPHEII